MALPACVVIHSRYGDRLPDSSSLTPGLSTRADVLAALGPPAELGWPTPWRGNDEDPQRQRVLDEHDLFDRRIYTWVHERRRDRGVIIVPIFTVFSWWKTEHDADRLMVLFDEAWVVQDLAMEEGDR
jgi:hypothetical protein